MKINILSLVIWSTYKQLCWHFTCGIKLEIVLFSHTTCLLSINLKNVKCKKKKKEASSKMMLYPDKPTKPHNNWLPLLKNPTICYPFLGTIWFYDQTIYDFYQPRITFYLFLMKKLKKTWPNKPNINLRKIPFWLLWFNCLHLNLNIKAFSFHLSSLGVPL